MCDEFVLATRDKDLSDDEYKALAKALKPSERQLFWVIDLDESDKGPQILDISYAMFGELLDKELNEGDESLRAFADLEDGLTVKIRFSPKTIGKGKPFPEASRIDFEKRRRGYPDTLLDDLFDLDKCLKEMSFEQVDAIFSAAPEEGGGEGERAKERPARTRTPAEDDIDRTPTRGGRPVTAPDGPQPCKACEGTGKNAKGKTCPTCWGSKVEPDDGPTDTNEAPPAREERPAPARTRTAPPPTAAAEEEAWPDDDKQTAPPPATRRRRAE